MVEVKLSAFGSTVSLRARELGRAAMTRPRLTSSALAAADPPVGKADESCPADAMRALLLLSRSRTPRTPAEPKKVLVGAKRIRAFVGRMNGLVSVTVGRLTQALDVLYCQLPCPLEAALLTMATPPRVRIEVSAVPALMSEKTEDEPKSSRTLRPVSAESGVPC